MKRTVRTFAMLALVVGIIIQGCSTESSVVDTKSTSTGDTREDMRRAITAKAGPEGAARILSGGMKNQASVQTAISYAGTLCPGVAVTGACPANSIYDSGQWTYYKFYGVAGASVVVTASRIGCGMDPAFSVFQGTTTSNDGVNTSDGGPDMTFLGFGDDNLGASCGCFGDPYVAITLPATGWYTVAIFDFIGCGDPREYSLTVTGNICDSDGDGVNDDVDAYPNSDMSTNVTIDGCDSGTPNHVFSNGATMMDLINACAASATNHGGFVSCVTALSNGWKKDGLITGAQKGKIQSCAGSAAHP